MNPLRIAILGGCLNSGYHVVSLNQLYHRIMARTLEQQLGRPVRVTLGRLDTHQHTGMIERAADLIARCNPDVLLFQIRPDFLWGLYSAIWLKRHGKGPTRLRKNPHLAYGNLWPEGVEESICSMHRFAAQNLHLAQMMGVTQQAHDGLIRRLEDVKILTQKSNTSLGLISPLFGSYYHPRFQKFTNDHILPLLSETKLPIMDLMSDPMLKDPSSWADQFHLNATGHQIAAQIAIQTLLPLLQDSR